MATAFTFLSLACVCGLVSAQYGLPPNFNNFNNRPEDAQFMPRYSAGSGNSNYNSYNGANNNAGPGPNGNGGGGDSLASLGLGGLSGFYSALTNELQYAGNSFGAGTTPSPSGNPSTVKAVASTPESDLDASTVKYTTKPPSSNDNRVNSNNNYNDNYNGNGNGNGNSPFGGSGYGGNSPFGGGQGGPGFGGPSPFGGGPGGPGFGGGSPFGGPQGGPGFGGGQGGPGGYGGDSPFGGPGGPGFGGGSPFGGPGNGNNGPYGGPQNGPNDVPSRNAPLPGTPGAGPVNLGDTSVLKNMGLEQLGSFFGSMVSELNNAGAQVGGPVVAAVPTTPKSLVPAQPATAAAATTSASR